MSPPSLPAPEPDVPRERQSIFTQNKFKWLDQVSEDAELSPNAFRVAYRLAQHLNRDTNLAPPSQTLLAKRLGMSRRTVQAMIEQLVKRGHLQLVDCGRGRGRANHYRPFRKVRMKPEQAC
ncbi:helix-turn-helix domain-containing protein [Microvirga aerophila]